MKPPKTDADFQYADGETAGGEESPIMYISPRVSGGKVTSMDSIEVRIKEGLFNVGDVVQLKHPNYNGKAEVSSVWDAKDGGGSAIIDGIAFVDTGERNVAPYQENPIDRSAGTIQVLAEAYNESEAGNESESEEGVEEESGEEAESADGDFQYADDDGFFNAKGKSKRKARRKARVAKIKAVIKKFKGKRKKLITKAQARIRKAAKLAGKKKGLKGVALRKFIRTAKPKKLFRKFDGEDLLFGVDGENSHFDY